jgi:hypothetical protein
MQGFIALDDSQKQACDWSMHAKELLEFEHTSNCGMLNWMPLQIHWTMPRKRLEFEHTSNCAVLNWTPLQIHQSMPRNVPHAQYITSKQRNHCAPNKSFFFWVENAGEMKKKKGGGGPQQDPHSYGDQIWVRQLPSLKV